MQVGGAATAHLECGASVSPGHEVSGAAGEAVERPHASVISHPLVRSHRSDAAAAAPPPDVRPLAPGACGGSGTNGAATSIRAPEAWRALYHQVERCAGLVGDYDRIRWAVMEAPLQGPKGPTYGFTVGDRIVLVRNDTTYLRHEMLHHVLETAGWQPRALKPGEHYTIVDLHPMPLFGLCTGGH
jgi:hypothetical protein